MQRLLWVMTVIVMAALTAPAWADPGAEVKAAKKIEKHEAVDPGDTFAAGDTVFAWSKITGMQGKKITHVWKKDGKEVWRMDQDVKNGSYRTYSKRRSIKAGAWTVEVVAEDGSKLGEVSFTVQ